MLKPKMFLFPETIDGGTPPADPPTPPTPPADPTVDIVSIQAELAKAKKAVNDLTAENADKKRQLKDKMTAEELKDAEIKDANDKLVALNAQIEQGTLTSNRALAETIVNGIKVNADIKEEDAEFSTFVHSFTSTDKDSTAKLASYFSKVVKQAYDKGIADTTSEALKGTGDGTSVGGDGKKTGEKTEYQKFIENQPKQVAKVDLG